MKLGIDLDDVTADFQTGFRKIYHASFGVTCPPSFDWDLTLVTHFKNEKDLWDWVEKDHPRFFHDLEPLPGAAEAIKKLSRDHVIRIITDKPVWAKDSPKFWLDKWNIPYDSIHVTKIKADVHCDLYLDDGPHNLVMLRTCTNAIVVRMVRPWNSAMNNIKDVNNWEEFVELVESL